MLTRNLLPSIRCNLIACGFHPLESVAMKMSSANGVSGGTSTVIVTRTVGESLLGGYKCGGGMRSGLGYGVDACTMNVRGTFSTGMPAAIGEFEMLTAVTSPVASTVAAAYSPGSMAAVYGAPVRASVNGAPG